MIRLDDIDAVTAPGPFATFQEAGLRHRSFILPPQVPAVDLDSFAAVIASASRLYAAVPLHREQEDPDIGHVRGLTDESVEFQEIDPEATWYATNENVHYALDEITRVDFGGLYEEALIAVGGPAPD